MTLHTCTKVNVGLHVLRRRPDGYHDLETLFVPYYGFGDELTVELSDELSIQIEREGGVDWIPMEDLTVRTWRLLKADFPQLTPVAIKLVKRAPVGAGLGGGSADAAFMLRALNDIGSLGLSDAELASYAARLGSDCAFFVYCRPMFATGRGEILEPFDIDLSGYELRVEIPLDASGAPVSVSTREAYAGLKLSEDTPPALLSRSEARMDVAGGVSCSGNGHRQVSSSDSGAMSLREALKLPVEQWRGRVVNDFEATVCPLHPEIPEMIDDFYRRGAVYAAMSGSGSAVFGLFRK